MLDVGQANELKLALRAARATDGSEWTSGDVKSLSNSSVLGGVLDVLRGRAEIVVKKIEETVATVKNIFSPIKSVMIGPTKEKKTTDCFADSTKYYRDSSVIKLLPETQEARASEGAVVNQLTENPKFVGMVQSLLNTVETGLASLSRLVIEKKRIFTLTQIEALVELQEAGEDVGLLTNGWANFFLVLNKEGSVSVVNVYRADGQWCVCVYPLGRGLVWLAENRFFYRN